MEEINLAPHPRTVLPHPVHKHTSRVVVLIATFFFVVIVGGASSVLVNTQLRENITHFFYPNATKQAQQPQITWVSYTNAAYPSLTFQYPQGAQITITDPDTAVCSTDCYSLTLSYQTLTMHLTHQAGIGTTNTLYGRPYTIVSGTKFAGIGKDVQIDPTTGSMQTTYFAFANGAQQANGFLLNATGVNFTYPQTSRASDEPLSDSIATSFLHQTPLKVQPLGAIFANYSNGTILSSGSGNNWGTIFTTDSLKGEHVQNAVVNQNGTYAIIVTYAGTQPTYMLSVYNLQTNTFVQFGGATQIVSSNSAKYWNSATTFLDSDGTGAYQYDVTKGVRTPVDPTMYENWVSSHRL